NTEPQGVEPSSDPLSGQAVGMPPLLSRDNKQTPLHPVGDKKDTLDRIEEKVGSEHLKERIGKARTGGGLAGHNQGEKSDKKDENDKPILHSDRPSPPPVPPPAFGNLTDPSSGVPL
ncbi:MAG: hypothetical protein ACREGC_02945, partial [Minisyncoccia bacterium]